MNWKTNKWGAAMLAMMAPPFGLLYANRARSAGIYFVLLVGLALLQFYLFTQGYAIPLALFLS